MATLDVAATALEVEVSEEDKLAELVKVDAEDKLDELAEELKEVDGLEVDKVDEVLLDEELLEGKALHSRNLFDTC